MKITQFTMEEVRCFSERQTLEIRPLTFLVGENSTGKTTALACFHVLANYLRNRGVDFNSHPYSMGTFKDIVRNSRKKEKVFKLGSAYEHADETVEWTVEFVQKNERIEPAVNSIAVKFTDGEIVFKTGSDLGAGMHLTDADKERNQYRIVCEPDYLEVPVLLFDRFSTDLSLDSLIGKSDEKNALAKFLQEHEDAVSLMSEYTSWDSWHHLSVLSTSPIRSRPERTYDPTREFSDPEGSDVPMQLMRIAATGKDYWEALKEQLVEFGKVSGLFQNIEVKNLGGFLGAPFQLKFKVRGPSANIIDVGYGVSQILPILVQILNLDAYSENPFFLLQQPEVHLHPRAQAEFTSLLVQLANTSNRSFIIETHSDYMIDRARIDIRKGHIRPEDVSLIYFEPKRNIVKVHNIGFDKLANMINVPPRYREFFLKESDRLMGFED